MSKEDILWDHCSTEYIDPHKGFAEKQIMAAMDEYAKQEAIGFKDWLDERYVQTIHESFMQPYKAHQQENLTTEELYTLYIKSKK